MSSPAWRGGPTGAVPSLSAWLAKKPQAAGVETTGAYFAGAMHEFCGASAVFELAEQAQQDAAAHFLSDFGETGPVEAAIRFCWVELAAEPDGARHAHCSGGCPGARSSYGAGSSERLLMPLSAIDPSAVDQGVGCAAAGRVACRPTALC